MFVQVRQSVRIVGKFWRALYIWPFGESFLKSVICEFLIRRSTLMQVDGIIWKISISTFNIGVLPQVRPIVKFNHLSKFPAIYTVL